jgi:hypothetical protein
MKLIDFFLGVLPRAMTFIENVGGALKKRAFPSADHCGVDTEALHQLGGGLFVLQSGQRHLGLEFGTVLISSFAHGQTLSFSD